MNPSNVFARTGALALVSLLAGGCAMWNSMDRPERGIAVAPAGAAVVSRPASAPTVRLAQLALNDRGYGRQHRRLFGSQYCQRSPPVPASARVSSDRRA